MDAKEAGADRNAAAGSAGKHEIPCHERQRTALPPASRKEFLSKNPHVYFDHILDPFKVKFILAELHKMVRNRGSSALLAQKCSGD